jgi:hypothetical protein
MCFGPKPQAPPPPPPPAPPINPIEIAPTEDAAGARKRKKLGASMLQIPLVGSPTAGLGIPTFR